MSDETRQPGESFLAHRARLKAARQRDAAALQPAAPVAKPEVDTSPAVDAAAPRPLTDADMPPVESLTAESDFSQFLAEGVSDALRRAALRKLFQLPEFGVLDGLNEYDEDYTQFEKLGDMVTYHQRRMWAREEAEKAAAERDAAETGQAAESDPQQATSEPGDEAGEEPEAAVTAPAQETIDEPLEDDGDLQA